MGIIEDLLEVFFFSFFVISSLKYFILSFVKLKLLYIFFLNKKNYSIIL